MKNQVLSIKQMQELIDLGIDVSKASMCWNYNDENSYWALVVNFTHSPYLEGEIIPTFTLYDILDVLPKYIEKQNYNYELEINFPLDIIMYYDFLNFATLVEINYNNLLEGAANMLKWCKQNGYL